MKVNLYAEYQELQYFNTKEKLNSGQGSWYLHMSKFIYYIYYKCGFKTGKPDGLLRLSGEEKSAMDVHFFDERQLLDHVNDNVGE